MTERQREERLNVMLQDALYWYKHAPTSFAARVAALKRSVDDINNTIRRLQNETND